MPRVRRQGRISIISVDVPTVLRRKRRMTTMRQRVLRQQASDALIAELNADLRSRDPMRIMKQQIRLKTIDEIRQRLDTERVAPGDSAFDMYPRMAGILDDLERLAPA
jgi:hypothetical protein